MIVRWSKVNGGGYAVSCAINVRVDLTPGIVRTAGQAPFHAGVKGQNKRGLV